MNCACGTEKDFKQCCEPFIEGTKNPATAEQLMRSRYTAITLGNIQYIEDTSSPEERKNLDVEATKKWAEENEWKRLEIIETEKGGPGDKTGVVEFKAIFDFEGDSIEHHEVSQFRKDNLGKWLFAKGQAHTHKEGEGDHHHRPQPTITRESPKVGRNDPCHCGSSKKYKKCCANKDA